LKRNGAERLRLIFRALGHRNFRLFFAGQSISLVGTWMQRVALGWLVYRLTHSAFLLGLVSFSGQIPTLFFAPFAGVFADRWNKHRLLVVTQSLAMLQAFVLSFLVLTGMIRIWQIIVLGFILGIINAVDLPIRQSFTVQMIDNKQDLGNAIALNSSMVNGARMIGPSAAGLLIAVTGEGICFLLNGISYIAVVVSLLLMRIPGETMKQKRAKVWGDLKEGLSYAAGFKPIRAILLMLTSFGLIGMPYMVLMPIFAKDILHGQADILGFLMGAAGVGALGGALYLAARKTVLGLDKMIPLSAAVFGVGLIIFSFSHDFRLSLSLLLLTGFGQMIQMAGSNTLLQTIVDDDKRGRIMSLYATALMGMAPLGGLLAGSVAGYIGASHTVLIAGSICIVCATLFAIKLPAMRRIARPVYISKGIIPEIAMGIQAATEGSTPEKYPKQ
jgi:MFS family permease